MSAQNTLASTLRRLHTPGKPLILANVYDTLSALAVAPLPACRALTTASYAVARAAGTDDDSMILETNLAAVRAIAPVAAAHNKPLTVDLQDGHGDQLEEAIRGVIKAGAVGINLEDCDKETQRMYKLEDAVGRIKRALKVAKDEGVPAFAVNARCDTLIHGGEILEVMQRGRAYLDAGAVCVFVWGGSKRGVSREEVKELTKAFEGRLNVALLMAEGKGYLTVRELANIGVAGCSVGPQIQFAAMEKFAEEAEKLLGSVV